MNTFFTWEKIKHFIDITSIILAIVLSPITVLILLSQNSVPGNLLYSYKRGLENTVLAVASLHPATRVAFRTGLTERRFDEAQTLLSSTQDISGLREFVREVAVTNKELESISNPEEKKKLEEKLNASLDEYQKRLKETKVVLIAEGKMQEIIVPAASPVEDVGQQPSLPTNTPVPIPTARPGEPAQPTNTPVSIPTPTLEPVLPTTTTAPGRPTSTPRPTATPHPSPRPTVTSTPRPISTLAPTPTLRPSPQPTTPGDAVDKTEQYLECLRRKRENPALVCIPPFGVSKFSKDIEPSPTTSPFVPTVTPLPTATPQPAVTPRPTDDQSDSKEKKKKKEKEKEEKVKGVSTKAEDPFIELFDWIITPFVAK